MEELRKERKRLMKELKQAHTKSSITGKCAVTLGSMHPHVRGLTRYANKKYLQAMDEYLMISKQLDEVDKKIHEESLRRFEAEKRA